MSAKLVDMCAKIQTLEKVTEENNAILTGLKRYSNKG